ncbi:transglutaminase family protein [Reichenbachiella versicolor]|uniref:transglutaminase family protein n=1 Tax=Reichenbachiella versicolor TaxID=1821036 RepID=UPI000D6E9283|nr:transglutaminase family protein [Reichenbachiella versicolor]
MRYQVRHVTKYKYNSPAELCHNIVYQCPSDYPFQKVNSYKYRISPEPNYEMNRRDFFENQYLYFSIQKLHKELSVESIAEVTLEVPQWMKVNPLETQSWEEVVEWLRTPEAMNDTRQFYLGSTNVELHRHYKEYALESFMPGRPIMAAMMDLNERIFNDFKFTPGFTDISTPVSEVFKTKKGVCQDFAHFGLACLRSIGLAARYMSGYIETIPPPGKPKLVGADASHAWIALFIPDIGWVEFDSTNNLLVSDQHIRTASGRDFSDVIPLKGIVYSGGDQEMDVTVDVNQLK